MKGIANNSSGTGSSALAFVVGEKKREKKLASGLLTLFYTLWYRFHYYGQLSPGAIVRYGSLGPND